MRTFAPRRVVLSVSVSLAGLLAVALAPAARADPLTPYTGFTRPGSPNDTRKPDGQIVLVSTDADASKRAVGATVYFMVLERKDGDKDGTWGSGIKDLAEHFRRGVDSGGSSSPGLDTGAKYLYLYQTVNDRGTDLPVQSAAVELLGDPKKKVTSWGSFAGVGFALSSGGEGRKEEIEPVSTSTRDAAESEPAYRSPAPAVQARRSYRLSLLPTRRGPFSDQPGGGVAKVIQEILDPVHEPDYVMVLAGSGEQRSNFRAIWNGYLPKGARSSVYGFTSNRPPTLQSVQVNGIGIQAPGGIRPAAAGEEPGAGREVVTVSAEGSAPTPRPASTTPLTPETPGTFPSAFPSPPAIILGPPILVPVPVPGGTASSGGGSASSAGLGTGAGGGFGGGGGGSGSGSGGGAATQARQQQQQQAQQQQQGQSGLGSLTLLQQINLNVQVAVQQNTQVNQNQSQAQGQAQSQNQNQSQSQSQNQSQSQGQSQNQNGDPPTELIPEPPAVVLGLIALPFLVWLLRRHPSARRRLTNELYRV